MKFMKTKIYLLTALLLALVLATFTGCPVLTHEHTLEHVEASEANCTTGGNAEYWYCSDCGKCFLDEGATREASPSELAIPVGGHKLKHLTVTLPTCTQDGNVDCWHCSVCDKYFGDMSATTELDPESAIIEKTGHEKSETLKYDETNHWYTCSHDKCNVRLEVEEHSFDDGVAIDGTYSTFTCQVCGYTVKRPSLSATLTGKISGTGLTDYSDFIIVMAGAEYSYTYSGKVSADGTYSIDVPVGTGYKMLVYSGSGYSGVLADGIDVTKENNPAHDVTVKSGAVLVGDVELNGSLVKAWGNVTSDVIEDCLADNILSVKSSTISSIPSAGWGIERTRYLLPVATQIKSGTFAYDVTIKSSSMYGYAGVGITDGTSILFIETPSQTTYDEGGVRLCFGTYTETGWNFGFAMIIKCGGVDSQTAQSYQQRFSIRRYEDSFKLFAGDVCFAILTADDGLIIQDNYKMINTYASLKRDYGTELKAFMSNTNEYALIYGCDYGISTSKTDYIGQFDNEYTIVGGKVNLPDGYENVTAEDVRIVVEGESGKSTFTGAVDADGNYSFELPTGSYTISFTHPSLLVKKIEAEISADTKTLESVTLEKDASSSSSVIINGQELKIGQDIADTSSTELTEAAQKNYVFSNSIYAGDAKFTASFKASNIVKNENNMQALMGVGLTDGSSMMRVVMRANYTNMVEFEYLLVNGTKNGYWVSNYRTYKLTAEFLPSFNDYSTDEAVEISFVRENGEIKVYCGEHLLVTVKNDGFYVAEGITTPSHTLNEERRLPDVQASWGLCPAQPESAFMSEGRELAIWALTEPTIVGGQVGFDASVTPIHKVVDDTDEKADALKEVLGDKYFSLLGDSISTWDGISNSGENNDTITSDYNSCYPYYDVDKLEEVYWYQLMQKTGMNLLVNNSIGGSRAYGAPGESTAACNTRCENLHANTGALAGKNPDIIFIYIGINDVGATNETAEQFAEGYRQIIAKVTAKYTEADIFVVDLPYPGSSPWLAQYDKTKFDSVNASINSIADEYNLPVIHLRNSEADDAANLTCDQLHPNVEGMKAYYRVFRDALYDFYCADK